MRPPRWMGDPAKGERSLRPLRKSLKPFEDIIKSKAYLDDQRGGLDVPEGDVASHRRCGHFARLTASIIDVIIEYLAARPLSRAELR